MNESWLEPGGGNRFYKWGLSFFTIVNESVWTLFFILRLTRFTPGVLICTQLWTTLSWTAAFSYLWLIFSQMAYESFHIYNSSRTDMFINILGLTLWHPYCECLHNWEWLWNELLHFPNDYIESCTLTKSIISKRNRFKEINKLYT